MLCDSGISCISSYIFWHFMWTTCLADNQHEMSSLIFSERNKNVVCCCCKWSLKAEVNNTIQVLTFVKSRPISLEWLCTLWEFYIFTILASGITLHLDTSQPCQLCWRFSFADFSMSFADSFFFICAKKLFSIAYKFLISNAYLFRQPMLTLLTLLPLAHHEEMEEGFWVR